MTLTTSKPRPTNKSNSCPVCGDTKGKCRTFDGKPLVLCMTVDYAPSWKDLGSTKDGLWKQFAPDNESSFDRDEWQRRKREEKPVAVPQTMSLDERDRFYRGWLAKGSLNERDRADLERRGITDFSIAVSYEIGYAIPFKGLEGGYVGAQWRYADPGDGSRYRWHNLPGGKEFPGTDEMPIAVYRPSVEPKGIALVEGTGVKPMLAAERLGMVAIGAAGGNHLASPIQMKAAIEEFPGLPIVVIPDAGDVINPKVMSRHERTAHQFPQVKFLWWKQVTKQENDIDEAARSEIESAQLLTWAKFAKLKPALAKEQEAGHSEPKQSQKSVSEARKAAYWAETAKIQEELNTLRSEPTIRTEGRYIPKGAISLPPRGGIINGVAPRGSGKTQTALDALVSEHRSLYPKGLRVSIVPRNSQGRQSGRTLKLPHHEEGGGGCDVTLCGESIFKVSLPPLKKPNLLLVQKANTAPKASQLALGEVAKFDRVGLLTFDAQKTAQQLLDIRRYLAEGIEPPMLIFDEASQTLGQLLDGETYRGNHTAALSSFRKLFKEVGDRGGYIVLTEADLTNCEVDLVVEGSGLKVVEHFQHTKVLPSDQPKRQITIFEKPAQGSPAARTLEEIIDSLSAGENLIGCSDASKFLRKTERKLEELGYKSWDDGQPVDEGETYEGRQIWILDKHSSHTRWAKELADGPDRFFQKHPQTRFFGHSPSISASVSINDPEGHFSGVAFHFTHLPARDAVQMPDRLRTDVRRFGYVAKRGFADDEMLSSCRPDVILRDLSRNKDGALKLLAFAEHAEKDQAIAEVLTRMQSEALQPDSEYAFWLRHYARYEARRNWGRVNLRAHMIASWEADGYEVTVDDGSDDPQTTADIKRISEALERDESGKIADIDRYVINLPDGMEVDLEAVAAEGGVRKAEAIAREMLGSMSGSNPKSRRIAKKFIDKSRLATCNLDDPEFVYKAIVSNRGKFLTATELLWLSQNQEAAKQKDLWSWDGAFGKAARENTIVWIPNLTMRTPQAKLIAECPLQPFIDGKIDRWDNETPEAIAVHQWALLHKRQFKRYLRLQIGENHTPVETVNKLLKKIGFETYFEWSKGGRKKRKRQYFITNLTDKTRTEIMNSLTVRYLQDLEAKNQEQDTTKSHDEATVIDGLQIIRDGIKWDVVPQVAEMLGGLPSDSDRAEIWRRLSSTEKAILENHQRAAA